MADRLAVGPCADYGWGDSVPHIQAYLFKPVLRLLREAGFVDLRFLGACRWPWLWKSMLMAGRQP